MKKISLMVIALAVVFLTLSAVYAYGEDECRKPEGKSNGKERVFQELNLAPEQKKQLEVNRSAQRQETEKLFNAIKQKQEQLRQALNNSETTQSSIAPLANEIKSLQAELLDNRIRGILAVKAILTPEQFAKFQEMAKNRQEKKGERFRNKRQEGKGDF
jgi:protein CpxP